MGSDPNGPLRARSEESKRAKKYIVEQLLARGYKKTEIAERLGVSRAAGNFLVYTLRPARSVYLASLSLQNASGTKCQLRGF